MTPAVGAALGGASDPPHRIPGDPGAFPAPGLSFAQMLNRSVDRVVLIYMINHMVEHDPSYLDAVFHDLDDPTRRVMLRALAEGERSVGELAAPFSMSFAGASKHLKVLEKAGLVRRRVAGRTHYCRLEAARLAEAEAWLRYYERFWTKRLDTLQGLLGADAQADDGSKGERSDRQPD